MSSASSVAVSYTHLDVYKRQALNKLAHIDATQRADTRFYEEMQEMLQDTDYYQIEDVYKRQVYTGFLFRHFIAASISRILSQDVADGN